MQFIRVTDEPEACDCDSHMDVLTFPDLLYLAVEDTDRWDDVDAEAEHLASTLVSNILRIEAENLTHLYTYYAVSVCSSTERRKAFEHLSDKAKHPGFSTWLYHQQAPLDAKGTDVTTFPFDSLPVQSLGTRFPKMPLSP